MPIVFLCPESSLECIHEKKYAGKTFKCMHCDQTHRIPGLDLSQTKGGYFTFYCENTEKEFRLKNAYYGDKFHCPKCKKFHIAKPKGEVEDVSGLTPDIKPMEIHQEDPVKLSAEDRRLRKKSTLKSGSTNSKLKRKTSINARMSASSGTVLMSVEEENDMLNQIITEQLHQNIQSKKSYKLQILTCLALIPLVFGIVFFLDKQNHDGIQSSLQQAQAHSLKMEFKKAVFQMEQAIRYQDSKLLFYKENNSHDINTTIENYKKMQAVFAQYEDEVNPLLLSSTKIYDLHKYHQKIDEELTTFNKEDLIYKYLLDKKFKLLKKEKALIETRFQKELSKAKKMYQEGKLQAAINYNSLTYRAWMLFAHKEIQVLHRDILETKLFFNKRKIIIDDIARVEDMTDTMGTSNDSLETLTEAKRLADSIIERLDQSDTPLRQKIEKLREKVMGKLSNTKEIISQTPEAIALNKHIIKEFVIAVELISSALKELDGEVITKTFPKKTYLSSENYSFTLLALDSGDGYSLMKDTFYIKYNAPIVQHFPKYVILHFHTIKKAMTPKIILENDLTKATNFQYTLKFVDYLRAPFVLYQNNGNNYFIGDKQYQKKPLVPGDKNNLNKLVIFLSELKKESDLLAKEKPLWGAVSKAITLLMSSKVRLEQSKIIKQIIFSGYLKKVFPEFPASIDKILKKLAQFEKENLQSIASHEYYQSADKSQIDMKIAFHKIPSTTMFDNIKKTTSISARPYFSVTNNNVKGVEILISFTSIYTGNKMESKITEDPIQLSTSHPAVGVIATYNTKTKKLTSDLEKWNRTLKSGYTKVLANEKDINFNLKPYCLQLNTNGYVKSIITKSGKISFPDFTNIQDQEKKRTAQSRWINKAARALYHPRELHLFYKAFFLYEDHAILKWNLFLKDILKATRVKNQTLSQTIDRQFAGRVIGNDLDLAVIYAAITWRQNRLSHVINTPRGPVCCWVENPDENEYVLNILRADRPLQYKGTSLEGVLTKAFSQHHTSLIPFNPNEIDIIIPLSATKKRQTFRISSKVLVDRKLFLKLLKEKQTQAIKK